MQLKLRELLETLEIDNQQSELNAIDLKRYIAYGILIMINKRYCPECGKEILSKTGKFCSKRCSFIHNVKSVTELTEDECRCLNLDQIEVINDKHKYTVYGYGRIIKISRQVYLDQLDGRSKIHSSNFANYINSKYNLSEKEYFNLVVYGNEGYVRRCLNCGRELPFLGLNKDTCRSYRTYCGAKCETEYRMKMGTHHFLSDNRSNLPSMVEHDIRAGIRGKLEYEMGIHKFQDVENTILMSKNQFIKNFKVNRGYSKAKFYWAMLSDQTDYFKIGVTTSDLSSRASHVRGTDMPYKSIHLIVEDDIDKIADLEYLTKLKFKDFRKIPSTEIFPISKFREILEFVKSIK